MCTPPTHPPTHPQTLIDTLASAAADPAAAPPPGAVERAIAKAAELQAATDKLAVVALQQQQALQQVLQQRGLELPLPTTSGGAGDRVPPPKAGGTQRAPVGAPQGTPLGTPLLPVRPDKPSTPPVGHKESGGPTVTEEGPVATGPSDADVLAPLVLNQHMSVEWQVCVVACCVVAVFVDGAMCTHTMHPHRTPPTQHEKEALQAEITRLQAHREWADAKIDQLISKAKKEQWPLLTETARLKEEVAALRAEKDGLEGKLKEFERSLYKLKDTTFKEAAAKRDYEKRVQAAEAELKGIMLRDSVCAGWGGCCISFLGVGVEVWVEVVAGCCGGTCDMVLVRFCKGAYTHMHHTHTSSQTHSCVIHLHASNTHASSLP